MGIGNWFGDWDEGPGLGIVDWGFGIGDYDWVPGLGLGMGIRNGIENW